MKLTLTLLIAFIVTLSSCGIHIQKRLYRNGFYISTNSNRDVEPASTAELSDARGFTLESAAEDTTSNAAANTEFKTEQTQPVPSVLRSSDTLTTTAYEPQTVNTPSDADTENVSPPDEVPAAEMESLHTLYIASIIVLASWIILSPLSTIASIILSLIILSRIRALKAIYSFTTEQQAELEKVRTFEVVVLGSAIAAILLMIALFALFIALFTVSF